MSQFKSLKLEHSLELYSANDRIAQCIRNVLSESEDYAADEIVELAEEVLCQLAARGFSAYLESGNQKEVYNDFLLELFNSSGHDYNAGPLYRWAAHMFKDGGASEDEALYAFFWEISDGDLKLTERVHHLSELRNQVMHGFFVLPAARNLQEAEGIGQLLVDLHEANLFQSGHDFHFFRENQFTGSWGISADQEWQGYFSLGAFGALAERVFDEQSEAFWSAEAAFIQAGEQLPVHEEVSQFITSQSKGAFALWYHPKDKSIEAQYRGLGRWLGQQPQVSEVCYRLDGAGNNFSAKFLLNRILTVLDLDDTLTNKRKRAEDRIRQLRRKNPDQKVVVLVCNVEVALFSPQHIAGLSNFFFENDILFLALGHHYRHFEAMFNAALTVPSTQGLPQTLAVFSGHVKNYFRFKGPTEDRAEELPQVKGFQAVLEALLQRLHDGEAVYARRFSDEHDFGIEQVHEAFDVLHPWVKSTRVAFEQDKIHELFGHLTTSTETTPLYTLLGRRDVRLEYEHKVLQP